jgi:molybdopterin-guanine dinucleotide biosynthesis adapter protein
MSPLFITVTGPKKSGKTSTIEALIPCLKEAGIRVASLKHTIHDHLLDVAGTDSYRHSQAGAERVAIITPEQIVLFSYNHPVSEVTTEPLLCEFFKEYDVVLCEGFRDSPFPKIVLEHDQNSIIDYKPPLITKFKPLPRLGGVAMLPSQVVKVVLDYIKEQLHPSTSR